VREIIKLVGEDPNREGLRKTPERFEKAFKFLTSGYHQNIDVLLNGATFSVAYDEMVIRERHRVLSLCEHHLLPFFGKAMWLTCRTSACSGSAKIARLVNMFCAPPADSRAYDQPDRGGHSRQNQSRGVGVIIEARHSVCKCAALKSNTVRPSPRACSAVSATTSRLATNSYRWSAQEFLTSSELVCAPDDLRQQQSADYS